MDLPLGCGYGLRPQGRFAVGRTQAFCGGLGRPATKLDDVYCIRVIGANGNSHHLIFASKIRAEDCCWFVSVYLR